MRDFYCEDFYWAVSVGGRALALFCLENDARHYFNLKTVSDPTERIELWRLNGGHLCTPPKVTRSEDYEE